MKTDIITIRADLSGSEDAMEAAEKFAAYYGITGRDALHLRLLTEETISLIHGILDDFSGSFWIESEKSKKGLLCRICLSAEKQVNKEQESHILSVASSGKNESAKGILGKIREILRRSLQTETQEDDDYLQNMTDVLANGQTTGAGYAVQNEAFWSLQTYRSRISEKKADSEEEWDELEKSIIAKLADEVKVWLDADATTVVIEKLIAN